MSSTEDRHAHWQDVWSTKDHDKVSWFQDDPALSLRLIHQAGLRRDAAIVDVGGGRSPLAGLLVEQGFSNVAVVDIAEAALARAHQDLGTLGDDVTWIAADVLRWRPAPGLFDLWHDRAVCHFFTTPEDQAAYAETLRHALAPGGIAIIATFAPDGPERCSGLTVARHDGASLSALLGDDFILEQELADTHVTPGGSAQRFCWCVFRRL
ncbi:MAG: class I SAM-dependent methyltransferase [Magnetospirillum gryphiswaldense]|nr:class I SAM-dependent methyltransferase [Magnetospirillum gryphiswaldense]